MGRKLFYEARGYTVTDCYYQLTDNQVSGGFSFAQYKAEIDAGRPVIIQVSGHSMLGYGYNDTGDQIILHDTWSPGAHTMTWGGENSGLAQWGVVCLTIPEPATIVLLAAGALAFGLMLLRRKRAK